MAKAESAPAVSPWEEEGRRQAFALDDCAFVLVMGDKPASAARVALGMGRVQALRRRTIVTDIVGLLPPIDDLVPFEWKFGVADVILRGMPLDKAVRTVEGRGKLQVLASGPAKLERADLMANERWMTLLDEIREDDALMIAVVPDNEPAVRFLLPEAYGVVQVGQARPLAGARILATIRGRASTTAQPALRTSRASARDDDDDVPLEELLELAISRPAARPHAVRRATELGASGQPAPPQRTRIWFVGLCIALSVAQLIWWWSQHTAASPAP